MDGWIGGAGAVAGGVVVVRVSEMDADRGGARVHGAGGGQTGRRRQCSVSSTR